MQPSRRRSDPIKAVLSVSSSSISGQAGQFGPNEWLVEEMYQRFLDDPTAVDPAWHDFFAGYRVADDAPPAGAHSRADAASNGTRAGAHGTGPAAPASGAATIAKPAPEVPAESPADGRGTNGAAPAPTAPGVRPARPGDKPAAGSTSQAAPRRSTAEHGTAAPLRGAASTVVKNMEASLEVPTATSVRAVPAKLLADNRLVINNQLRRTRGGKISFTHLIGYAVVRALVEMPAMNRHFAERDGRPAV